MALQNFVDKMTVVYAAWLNRVDVLLDTVFEDPVTKAQARIALTSDAPLEVTNGGTASRTLNDFLTTLYPLAQSFNNMRTAAEIAAGKTPTNYGFRAGPILEAERYGWSASASAAQNSQAVADCVAVLQQTSSHGGGAIQLPPGIFNSNGLLVPKYITLLGASYLGTDIISKVGTAYNPLVAYDSVSNAPAILLGGSMTELAYGCGVSALRVQLEDKDADGLWHQCCVDAALLNVNVQGALLAGRTNRCFVWDGGNGGISGFFNSATNCYAQHAQFGFTLMNSGTERVTQQMLVNCKALGDGGTYGGGGVGFRIIGQNGDGSLIMGGDFEENPIAIDVGALGLGFSVFGSRFENNTTDIRLLPGCQPVTFLGIETGTEYNVSDASNAGIFLGCRTTTAGAWKNRMPSGLTFGNTGDNLQKYIRLGADTFAAANTKVVTLSPVEPDANYKVKIQETAGAGTIDSYRISSKLVGSFTVVANNVNSNSFDWELSR